MSYTKTAWVNDSAPAVDATNLNKLEQGVYDAHQLIAAFQGVPTGMVLPYAVAVAPAGWLVCDGSAVSRTTYSDLHALLKDVGGANAYAWGAGNGSSTFNVPDFRGRVPAGQGTHADVNAVAKTDGVAVGSRRLAHRHSVGNPAITRSADVVLGDPQHRHPYHSGTIAGSNYGPNAEGTTANSVASAALGTDLALTGMYVAQQPAFSASGGTVGPQSGAEPVDTIPFVVVYFCIKA